MWFLYKVKKKSFAFKFIYIKNNIPRRKIWAFRNGTTTVCTLIPYFTNTFTRFTGRCMRKCKNAELLAARNETKYPHPQHTNLPPTTRMIRLCLSVHALEWVVFISRVSARGTIIHDRKNVCFIVLPLGGSMPHNNSTCRQQQKRI